MHKKNVLSKSSKKSSRDIYIVAGIIIIGIILRVLYFIQFKDSDLFNNLSLDAEFYSNFAKNIIESGDWIGKEVFFMNPGYPYFIALIYLLFKISSTSIILVQFLIGLLGTFLVFKISEKLFKKTTALITASLYVTFNLSIFYESLVLSDTLINFLGILILFILVYPESKLSLKRCFLAGLTLGVSVIFRPNILLFFVLIIGWLIVSSKDYKLIIKQIALICIGLFIIIFPVSLRNYIVGNEFVISTSSFGMNFYMGNHDKANGTYKQVPFARSDPKYEEKDFTKEASRLSGKELKPSESSSFWFKYTLKQIKRHPFKWTKLIIKKFYYFWNSYEISSNYNLYFYKNFIPLLNLLIISFTVIAPLGLIGFFLTIKSWKKFIYLYLYFFTHLFTNMLFFVLSEYRYPGVPILIIFAGFTVHWIFKNLKKVNYTPFIIALIIISIYPRSIGKQFHNNRLSVEHYNLGVSYMLKKQNNKAIKELKTALKLIPDFGEVYNTLGLVYKNMGMNDAAIAAFEKCIFYMPQFPEMYINLGDAYLLKNMMSKALEAYKKALDIEPSHEGALNRYKMINNLKKQFGKSIFKRPSKA